MNDNAALNLIRNTFENSFDRERFLIFAKNLFHFLDTDTFIYRGNLIPNAYDAHIKTLERLGKYEDIDGHKIEVLAVCLNKQSSLERARTLQRNFIAWYLNGSRGGITKDAALVAFYTKDSDDWRLSLVKMDYHLGESKAGKIKAITELTPARRFSFLVGASENTHTAQKQLLPIIKDTEFKPRLANLESAFSVEVVTKDFFEKYKKLFLDTQEALDEIIAKDAKIKADFQEKNIDTADFAKKLLGQIVFLYFLQKKGWFGVARDSDWGTGPKDFLRRLFEKQIAEYDNFFNNILEPLFYEALAVERPDNFYSRFDCKIPFLNGGLFDPLGNYDWVHTDIRLPDDLFSNNRKTKEGDTGDGILDVFDRYNFTVKEDEPLEREVAVDPEMLGKVFENLLEVKDRKSKGTYYTPREIVHYMCQESLINYLLTELNGKVDRDDIEILIRLGETAIEHDKVVLEHGEEKGRYTFKLPSSIRNNASLLDEKLEKIHVCDPAVGSGAFLVGMMTEIIRVRNILTNYLSDNGRSIYDFKRHAIQNCLYGVDIDPGAVEIAKLRLWLSLIVDEQDIKQIKPLPNLDYKIMQGNSLLEEYEGIKLFDEGIVTASPLDNTRQIEEIKQKLSDLQREFFKLHSAGELKGAKKQQIDMELKKYSDWLNKLTKAPKVKANNGSLFDQFSQAKQKAEELKKLHQEFFETANKREKDEIKKKIEVLEWELIEATLREQNKLSLLPEIEHFKKANIKPFFLWKLNFSEVFEKNDGFDVVIANPPYNAEFSVSERELYKSRYESVRSGRQDSAAIFVELAKMISGKNMSFAYILPYRLFSRKRNHGQFQIYTLNNFSVKKVIYLGSDVGFSASDEFMILIMSLEDARNNKLKVAFKPKLNELNNDKIFSEIDQSYLIEKGEVNLNIAKFDQLLLAKIENNTFPLDEICHVNDGIVPFIREKLISDRKIDNRYVPFAGIAGRYILEPYYFTHDEMYLCYDINEAKKYIKNKIELKKVQLRDKQIFLQRKILTAQNSSKLKGAIDENKTFVSNSLHSTYLKNEYKDGFYLEFILALLNSRLLNYYHDSLRLKGTDLHPQILVSDLKKLPIKNISKSEQRPLVDMVNKIFSVTGRKDYIPNEIEGDVVKVNVPKHKIDELVYKLYGLTPEEIAIVEGKNEK